MPVMAAPAIFCGMRSLIWGYINNPPDEISPNVKKMSTNTRRSVSGEMIASTSEIKPMRSRQETISPLPGLVPQVFFDLIARVAPGAFLLMCAHFLVLNDPQCFIPVFNELIIRFKGEEGARIIILLIFLFLSYFLALIL